MDIANNEHVKNLVKHAYHTYLVPTCCTLIKIEYHVEYGCDKTMEVLSLYYTNNGIESNIQMSIELGDDGSIAKCVPYSVNY